MVVSELRGEKIDIIPYNDEPARFVAKALSPARVREVLVDDEAHQATVIVPDDQLSLAIGREGQNARLAARLTGWRDRHQVRDRVRRRGGRATATRRRRSQRPLRRDPLQRPPLPERRRCPGSRYCGLPPTRRCPHRRRRRSSCSRRSPTRRSAGSPTPTSPTRRWPRIVAPTPRRRGRSGGRGDRGARRGRPRPSRRPKRSWSEAGDRGGRGRRGVGGGRRRDRRRGRGRNRRRPSRRRSRRHRARARSAAASAAAARLPSASCAGSRVAGGRVVPDPGGPRHRAAAPISAPRRPASSSALSRGAAFPGPAASGGRRGQDS